MTKPISLLIQNIGLVATPLGTKAVSGDNQKEIQKSENQCIGISDGVIICIGSVEEARNWNVAPDVSILDAGGCLVTPGLVDCHTHLVFGGWRQYEMAQKLAGVPYLDILKAGGGILSTVRSTREASFDELYLKSYEILDRKLAEGVTSVEIKSGYGLSTEHEKKQLAVISKLAQNHPANIVSTFLGAHAYPPEYKEDHEGYLKLLCEEMIPAVAGEGLATFCDVFCEDGIFDVSESRLILERAKQYGLRVKLHGDEIEPIGGAELAAEVGAISAEHLMASTDRGITAMAEFGTIAVLLPATSFYLDKGFARARSMITAGVPVAVATDFNPGSCPGYSLQFAMNLACLKYKLTPEEVLTAVTLNAAAAIGIAGTVGTIEPGKQADLLIWDAPDLNMILYRFGFNQVKTVIKNGSIIK